MEIWTKLQHLFKENDGSLPDIFVNDVSPEEVVSIYSWVLSLTTPYGDPHLWCLQENREIKISEIPNPALYYVQGKSEPFRHGLNEFSFNGCKIPQLSIYVGDSCVEFDYRMGKAWGSSEVMALFDFLCCIKRIAPSAKIAQAYEGAFESPNIEFSTAFEAYFNEQRKT